MIKGHLKVNDVAMYVLKPLKIVNMRHQLLGRDIE